MPASTGFVASLHGFGLVALAHAPWSAAVAR